MLTPLRRKLVVLTTVSAFFLLVTVQLVYQRVSFVDGLRSYIAGRPFEGDIGDKLLSSATTRSRPTNTQSPIPSPTGITAVPAPSSAPATHDKVIVVAKTQDEYVDWINEHLPNWPSAIYTVDDPSAPLRTAKNKGHEASAYLTYIIDNYERLPSVSIFIHAHQIHKHGTKKKRKRQNRIFEGIDYDNIASIRALNLSFVQRNGFTNLRCLTNPGCPAELLPFRPDEERDPLRPQEKAMAGAWAEIFRNDDVPQVIAAPCCAQFAVPRWQVLKRSRAEYEHFLNWLYGTELDDFTSGRIFEYLWHVIFGKEAVYCPDQE